MRPHQFKVGQIIRCSMEYWEDWRGRMVTVSQKNNVGEAVTIAPEDGGEMGELQDFWLDSSFAKRCELLSDVVPKEKVKKTNIAPVYGYMEKLGL